MQSVQMTTPPRRPYAGRSDLREDAWNPGMEIRWGTVHQEADRKAAVAYCTVGTYKMEIGQDDEIEYVFVPKTPFTEPVWGKVVNKN